MEIIKLDLKSPFKNLLFFSTVLYLALFPVDSIAQNKTSTQKSFILEANRSITEFINNIDLLFDLIQKESSIENTQVESIIPLSEEEFTQYYQRSYTTEKSKLESFDKSFELILELAYKGNERVLTKFFGMGELVDGEIAESYFSESYFIAESHKEKFCFIYQNLNELCRKRFNETMVSLCQ